MKNILSFFAISSLLFTACNNTNDDVDSNTQIKLTSSTEVKVNSGSAMAFITYDILEMVVGAEVKAEANVSWIGNLDYRQQGKINFTVERNPNDEPREGVITVSYDKSKFEVKIIQALSENPTNIVFEAEFLQGKYYGVQGGLFNYYLVFSDLGLDANNKYSTPNAHYYFVDLYLPNAPEDMENIVVPNGEYEYDINNSGWPNTFTHSFSWYHINDETGFQLSTAHYDTGKLIVEDGKVTLDITLQIDYVQENHKVVYEGDWSLIDCTNEVYE